MHNHNSCFSEREIKNLLREWDNGGKSVGDYAAGPSMNHFENQCLSTSELELRAGDVPRHYFSVGKNIFTDALRDRFWISEDLEFYWDYSDFGSYYMSEGRCNFVK